MVDSVEIRNGSKSFPVPPGTEGDGPPAAPPRICFGRVGMITNPLMSSPTLDPHCGLPLRHVDRITTDREIVTCEACLAVLSGKRGVAPSFPDAPPALIPGVSYHPNDARLRPAGGLRQALDALDVQSIRVRMAELKGELAACEVFLMAAEANEEARKESDNQGAV